MRRTWLLLREAAKSAAATMGFTLMTAAITAVLAALLLAMVGQTQAQNSLVVDGFSLPERRTVTFTASETAPILDWDNCSAISAAKEVESCWSLGSSFDVRNPSLDRGRLSARAISTNWRALPIELVNGRLPANSHEAIAESDTARALGLDNTGGVVEDASQHQWAIVGIFRSAQPRSPSGILVPTRANTAAPRSLNVVTRSPDGVKALTSLTSGILAPRSPGDLKVSVPEQLGELQGTLARGVRSGGDTVVLGIFAVNWFTIAVLSLLMVRARTLEFGRRRALGASRGWLLALVLTQGVLTVTPAAAAGASVGTLWTSLHLHHRLPWQLLAWLIGWQVTSAVTAQLVPALAACLRDPVRVLRSP